MKQTLYYGEHTSQKGDFYLPEGEIKAFVCLIHGGFWMLPYNYSQFNALSKVLSRMGYAVWNIEYRRIGEVERTFESCFEDAILAVNTMRTLAEKFGTLKGRKKCVIGHSAGGHLAVWLAGQALETEIDSFIGLAPILDLKSAFDSGAGDGVVEALMEGTPMHFPERYEKYSPMDLDLSASNVVLFHGQADDYVPVDWSEDFVEKKAKIARSLTYFPLARCGHMDFIEPHSDAMKQVMGYLEKCL